MSRYTAKTFRHDGQNEESSQPHDSPQAAWRELADMRRRHEEEADAVSVEAVGYSSVVTMLEEGDDLEFGSIHAPTPANTSRYDLGITYAVVRQVR